jgi:hypothetical protein
MVSNVRSINRELFVRQCVACGYDGWLLEGGQAEYCVSCGCDLQQRPARSYAEMEGLLGHPILAETPDAMAPIRAGFLQRWMVFIFFAMLGLMSLLVFAEAAVP